jgi:23S rRNA (uracil1939-C5)-methyltransferase
MTAFKVSKNCPYFNSCGGCDFLDLEEADYQNLKKKNVSSLFPNITNWIWVGSASRRRINLQIGAKNQLGFFASKSRNIVEIEKCFVAEDVISKLIPKLKTLLKNQEENLFTQVMVTSFDSGLDLVFTANRDLNFMQTQKLLNFAKEQNLNASYKSKNDVMPIYVIHRNQIFYPSFKIDLNSEIFIQATKQGLFEISKIIRNFIEQNQNIRNIADIYAGFGAYSFAIVDLIKSVTSFEGNEKMVELISKNSSQNISSQKLKSEIRDLFSSPITVRELKKFDLAIINPPRNGASPQVREIAKSALKNVIYVSCNPESFARDSKILIDSGFKITNLTALDQFYSTKHLELVAILQK